MLPLALQRFGFVKGRQGMTISESLRCAARGAHEWGHPFYVAAREGTTGLASTSAKRSTKSRLGL